MKKKILIDVNSVVPYFVSNKVTGIGRTTLELVQALSLIDDLPFEIELYSQNFKGIGAKNIDVPFCKKHLYLRNNERWNKIISKIPIREWYTGYDLQHIPHNFDYVHDHSKCIVTLHDALFMKIQEEAFEHAKMRLIVPPFIRKCKHIITCSIASKKDIIETMNIPEEKVSVIYWGIRNNIFKPFEDKQQISLIIKQKYNIKKPYFLSVSCNAERKRTDKLVKAFIKYTNNHQSNHDLVLVWGNPPKELLQEIAHSRCQERIHFLKEISDKDLAILYNGAKAFIFPSSYEGFGLPIIEAMACGTPVFTCKNSSLSEIAEDAAFFINEPIEQGLIDIFKRMDTDEFPMAEMREKGLNRASMFNWEFTAKETIKIYSKFLGI